MFLYIFKKNIKLIITSSLFDPGSTSKTLNLFFLRFNEQSGSENLAKLDYYEMFYKLPLPIQAMS